MNQTMVYKLTEQHRDAIRQGVIKKTGFTAAGKKRLEARKEREKKALEKKLRGGSE